jgi:hypothetical protein
VTFFRHFSLIVILFSFGVSPAFSQSCDQSFRMLLEKMARKNLDDQHFQFELFFKKTNAQQFNYELNLFDGLTPVAEISINNLKDVRKAAIRTVVITDGEYYGKGVGSYLYLLAAKDVYVKTGMLLQKSDMTSGMANEVWRLMTVKGFVKDDQFIAKSLYSKEVNEMYRKYMEKVKDRPLIPVK